MKMKHTFIALSLLGILSVPLQSQDTEHEKIPYKWNELTAPDFIKAVELADGICLLPAGIMEKHGAHLPLSTDMILAREIASRAAALEYALVFPEFYFGQIFEAKHQPGTVAYSSELVWQMLEETCEEMSRNGIRKIIIVNGHGGNNNLFSYFCQSQLARRKDYTVVFFQPSDRAMDGEVRKLRNTDYGGHADEVETSMVYAVRPTWFMPTGRPHNPDATRKGFPCLMAIPVYGGMPVIPTTMQEMDPNPTRPLVRWSFKAGRNSWQN
jgi:creatinine amidohydrolase